MSLIKCPECGKEISSESTSCPFCGCPSLKFNPNVLDSQVKKCQDIRKTLVITAILSVILMIIGITDPFDFFVAASAELTTVLSGILAAASAFLAWHYNSKLKDMQK